MLTTAIFAILGQPVQTKPDSFLLDGLYSIEGLARQISTDEERLVISTALRREVLFCRAEVDERERIKRDVERALGAEWKRTSERILTLVPSEERIAQHRQVMVDALQVVQESSRQAGTWASPDEAASRIAGSIEFVLTRQDPTREPLPWMLDSFRPLDYLAQKVAVCIDPADLVSVAPLRLTEITGPTLRKGDAAKAISTFRDAARSISDRLSAITVDSAVSKLLDDAIQVARQMSGATVKVYAYHDWRNVQVFVTEVVDSRVVGVGRCQLSTAFPSEPPKLAEDHASIDLSSPLLQQFQAGHIYPRADTEMFRNQSKELVVWLGTSTMDPLDLVLEPVQVSLPYAAKYAFISLPDESMHQLLALQGRAHPKFADLIGQTHSLFPLSVESSAEALVIVPKYPISVLPRRFSRPELRSCAQASLTNLVVSLKRKASLAAASGLGVSADRLWQDFDCVLSSLGALSTNEPLWIGYWVFGTLPASTQAGLLSGQEVPTASFRAELRDVVLLDLLSRGQMGFRELDGLGSNGCWIELRSQSFERLVAASDSGTDASPPWLLSSSTLDRVANMLAVDAHTRSASIEQVMGLFNAKALVGTELTFVVCDADKSSVLFRSCSDAVSSRPLDASHGDDLLWKALIQRVEFHLSALRGGGA